MSQQTVTFECETSAIIERVTYDTLMEALVVKFKNGYEYTYVEVPLSVFDNMKKAESRGSFFAKNIKNVYQFLSNKPKPKDKKA